MCSTLRIPLSPNAFISPSPSKTQTQTNPPSPVSLQDLMHFFSLGVHALPASIQKLTFHTCFPPYVPTIIAPFDRSWCQNADIVFLDPPPMQRPPNETQAERAEPLWPTSTGNREARRFKLVQRQSAVERTVLSRLRSEVYTELETLEIANGRVRSRVQYYKRGDGDGWEKCAGDE